MALQLRYVFATFLVSLLVTACVTAPPKPPEPPTKFSNAPIEKVRAAVSDPGPDCVKPFEVCDARTNNCTVIIDKGHWSAEKRAQWVACEDTFANWQLTRDEALLELDRRFPLPRCTNYSQKDYERYDVSPDMPDRDLILISKGMAVTYTCLQKNCAWVAENIPNLGLLADRCMEMKKVV